MVLVDLFETQPNGSRRDAEFFCLTLQAIILRVVNQVTKEANHNQEISHGPRYRRRSPHCIKHDKHNDRTIIDTLSFLADGANTGEITATPGHHALLWLVDPGTGGGHAESKGSNNGIKPGGRLN